ncbi:MAG: hemolysin family protein [Flavobacteriales bacterium]
MEFLIILILILLNGVFSMSEIALVSARKSKLESAAKRGDKNAKIALDTANAPNRFFSTVQIGITLIGILTGVFSGENMTKDLSAWFATWESLTKYADTLAVLVVVVIITFLSLVLGELVPKRIGLTNPEAISKAVARPMRVLTLITSPFVWSLTFTSDFLLKLMRVKPSSDSKITEEEIKAIIQEGKEVGEIDEIEQDIVERVFNLGDRRVSSLMTYRKDVILIDAHAKKEEVREIVNDEMHSTYPVYEEETDSLIGVVQLKDLFRHIDDTNFKIINHVKTPQYIAEQLSAYETLTHFKTSGVHFGIVIDEFGQMQGIVTMNDLLEALVGDPSEFHADEYTFTQREDGSWLVDGQYPLADFLRRFEMEEMISEFPFNTISGLILHELRSLPKEGQKLDWMNFSIEVVDMDMARIDKVLVRSKIN